jgi:hypothetical protein
MDFLIKKYILQHDFHTFLSSLVGSLFIIAVEMTPLFVKLYRTITGSLTPCSRILKITVP